MNISLSLFKKLISSSLLVSSLLILQSCSNPLAPTDPSLVPSNFRPGEPGVTNSAPVSSDGSLNVNYNAPASGTLVATDANSDPLTISLVTNPAHGTVTITNAATGSYTYTPVSNYFGADTFTFKANDSSLDSNIATITVTVNGSYNAPTAINITPAAFNEDTQSGSITLSYTDTENDLATSCAISSLVNVTETQSCACDGSGVCTVKVTGTSNTNGPASFSYIVTANGEESNTANATLSITSVNDAPSATAISLMATEDTAYVSNGTTRAHLNGVDIDGDSLTCTKVANPAHGTVTVNTDCSFTYTPSAGYNGVESFTFTVNDGTVTSAAATASITVDAVNDAPTLTTINTLSGATEDTAFTITFADLSSAANEADVDGDTLSFRIEAVSTGTLTKGGVAVTNGSTLVSAGESLVWTPSASANGTLNAFTVKAYDGTTASNSAVQVQVSTSAVNNAPTLTTISSLTGATEDSPVSISYATLAAVANEADLDGDTLSFRVEAVSTGTLTKGGVAVTAGTTLLSIGESLVWTPVANANGTLNAFTIKTYDGALASSTAIQVEVTTTAVNDAPILATNRTLTLKAGATATVTTASYLSVTDVDNSATQIIFTVGAAPTKGLFKKSGTTLVATNTFTQDDIDNNRMTYVHSPSTDTALDSLTLTISDGAGGTIGSTTFNIVPVVAPQTITRTSPASTPGTTTSVAIKAAGGSVVSGSTVKFYTDSSCSGTQFGTNATANGSHEASVTDTLTDGAYSFFATVALNSVVSDCSPLAGAANYLLDTNSPTPPTGIALLVPATNPGKNTTPQLRLSGGDAGGLGITAKVYTDNCVTLVGTGDINSADVTTGALGADGTYTFKAKLFDEAGNTSACSTATLSYALDTTGPTVAVAAPSPTKIKSGTTASFGVTYNGVGTGSVSLVSSGVTLGGTGTASCTTVAVLNGTTTTPTVNVSGCTGDGTITVTINASTATDGLNNASTASVASAALSVDNTAPNNGNSLSWSVPSPSASTSLTASWSLSNSSDIASQSIQFYTGANCDVVSGGEISLNAVATTRAFTGTVGESHTYKLTTVDDVGNTTTSSCSDAMSITFSMTVAPRYSIATNWMDYVRSSDGTTACDGTETSRASCIHGAQFKKVDLSNFSDCSGLGMTDAEGWFDWTCTDNGSTITFFGAMKSTINLRDTINFNEDDSPTFKTNTITLTGCGSTCPLSTSAATWWSNTLAVLPDNAGASPIKLDGIDDGGNDDVYVAGTILTLKNSRNTSGFGLNLDKIGVVLDSGTVLTHTGTSVVDAALCNLRATICLMNTKKFNYFSGTLNGNTSTGHYGIYNGSEANVFSHFGPIMISAYGANGIRLNGLKYATFKSIQVSNTTIASGLIDSGHGILAQNNQTDNHFGDVTVTSNGTTTSHHGIYVKSGMNYFNSITATSNTGNGIITSMSGAAGIVVSGAIVTSLNGNTGSSFNSRVVEVGSITSTTDKIRGVNFDTAVTTVTIGDISATSSGTLTNQTAVYMDTSCVVSAPCTISSITANNNAGTGVAINLSPYLNIGTITVKNNGSVGANIGFNNGTSYQNFDYIYASGNVGNGVYITESKDNYFGRIVSSNNNTNGVQLSASFRNRFNEVYVYNNGGTANGTQNGLLIAATANYNYFNKVVAAGNSRFGIQDLANYTHISQLTVVNNGFHGVYLNSASTAGRNIYNSVYSANNGSTSTNYGIYRSGTFPVTLSNVVSTNNYYGIYLTDSTNYTNFMGLLKVGSNFSTTTDCRSNLGTMPGLINQTCTTTGTNGTSDFTGQFSTATLYRNTGAPYTSASAFIGKVTADTLNTSDTAGTATYSTTLDFLNFDNIFRGWGLSGTSFPNSNNMGRCTTGTCQIWDWSISRSDTVSLNRSGNGSTVNNGVNANTNGVLEEIDGDGIGNNDGTCDSGELCENSFYANSACPVQVAGTNFHTSSVYTYSNVTSPDTNYSAGANGIKVTGNPAVGNLNLVCDPGEACVDSGQTCASGDQCVQKYLSKATEIMGDGEGDDDTLCESGEDCIYNPNIGAYQGHGSLVGPCTFQDGTITNVRMFGYENNGR